MATKSKKAVKKTKSTVESPQLVHPAPIAPEFFTANFNQLVTRLNTLTRRVELLESHLNETASVLGSVQHTFNTELSKVHAQLNETCQEISKSIEEKKSQIEKSEDPNSLN